MDTKWERVAAVLSLSILMFGIGVMVGRQVERPIAFQAGRQHEKSVTWATVMERMPQYEAFDRGYQCALDSISMQQRLDELSKEMTP